MHEDDDHSRDRRPVLARDLVKDKAVACLCPGAPSPATFVTFTTDRDHLQNLFAKHRPAAAVVIEACLLAGWVHDLCHELGLVCHGASPASAAWKFKHASRGNLSPQRHLGRSLAVTSVSLVRMSERMGDAAYPDTRT